MEKNSGQVIPVYHRNWRMKGDKKNNIVKQSTGQESVKSSIDYL